MNLLLFLLVGLIAGWLVGKLIRGRGFGLVGNVVVGAALLLFVADRIRRRA